MPSKEWYEETAKDIISEFDKLLINQDLRLNNENPKLNEFNNSNINVKDYNNLKATIIDKLKFFEEYVEYRKEVA